MTSLSGVSLVSNTPTSVNQLLGSKGSGVTIGRLEHNSQIESLGPRLFAHVRWTRHNMSSVGAHLSHTPSKGIRRSIERHWGRSTPVLQCQRQSLHCSKAERQTVEHKARPTSLNTRFALFFLQVSGDVAPDLHTRLHYSVSSLNRYMFSAKRHRT